ncbi:ATP-binding protein [Nitrogeniibacter aestuarii]|uniref:ATP-binding protein n=1 Tax=Nitrogeniibacter aestuarii TaxID=2815343 RepID=UPI001E373B54|nr:ATP-binding protein [Nitrogeniibacter aestuarii]
MTSDDRNFEHERKLDARVRTGLVQTHLESNRVSLAGSVVVSTLVLLFSDAEGHLFQDVLIWWVVLTLTTALRLWHVLRFKKAADPDQRAARLYPILIVEAAIAGALWGLLCTWLYPEDSSVLKELTVPIIMGVSSAALVSLGPILPAYIAFFGCMLIPGTVAMALRDSYVEHMLALVLGLLSIALLLNGIRISRNHMRDLRLTAELESALHNEAQARIAADAASEAKTRFLAAMSHEIRTPMNGVIGMGQLLSRTELNERQRRCLDSLNDSGKHLLGLIDEILDFAKVESGQLTVRHTPTDLRHLCQQVVDMFTPRAEEKRLSLLYKVSDSVPAMIETDPQRMRQILTNLVNNAIKFTSKGGVTVNVSARLDAEGVKPLLEIAVIDTGIGIAAEEQHRIFEAFAQVDDSMSRATGGVGLGLAISRDLARLMEGDLLCKSVPDVGTTFRLQLPLRVPAQPRQAQEVPQEPPVGNSFPRFSGCVLVVEDSPTNREVAVMTLQELGLECDIAEDGREALERLHERRYSLVLMDCQMPVMDGYEATRALRKLEEDLGWQRTPVIALTANAVAGNEARCFGAGMDDFVPKPFEIEDLVKALKRYLSVQRAA